MSPGMVDVGGLIDKSRFSPLQIRVVALCALASIFLMASTLSPLASQHRHWQKRSRCPRPDFAPIFSAGLLGALTGALGLGTLADRIGRKQVLIVSTVLFGLFSYLTVLATTFEGLLALRFLAGLGLGGAAPCFTALAAEYTPARKRPLIIGLMWASFPLGGMTGAFAGSYLLKLYGWPSIFYVGGILPIALSLILAFALPEVSSVSGAARQIANFCPLYCGPNHRTGGRRASRIHGGRSHARTLRRSKLVH